MSDSREMAEHQGGRELARAPASGGILGAVIEAARDPSVDADKMKSMVELGLQLQDREFRARFNSDKIAAIRAMPAIYKRGKSDKHRYAKFEDLHRAVMPILAQYNMTIDFRVGSEGTNITVQPILRHDNGQVEEGGVMKGPPDQGPGRSAVQAVGSTTSYLKRHSMKAMLNIIEDDEDDDGRGGSLATDQPNDRRARLVELGQQAVDEGTYETFWKGLNAKDRAWMITTGNHARLGGAEMKLPGPTKEEIEAERPSPPPPSPPPPSPPPPAPTQDESPTKTKPQTPEAWAEAVEGEISRCRSVGFLDEYLDGKRDKLARLLDSHPGLHKQITDAASYRRDQLMDEDR